MRWFVLCCAAVSLAACVVPEGPALKTVSGGSPGQGQVAIQLKLEEGERTLLGSSWAAATADAYELILIGPGGLRAVDLVLGPSQVVSVDPGTWRLVVLAGVKRTSGSTTAFLVGSATAEAVVVTAGQRTTVALSLRSIEVGVAPVGPAHWKAPLTCGAWGKTRNPRVGMLLAGASTTARPRFKSTELWNGYRECTAAGTPDDWTAEAAGTVPDGVASLNVGLVGAGLCLVDAADQWVPTAGLTRFSWFWPNRADMADTHPLAPWTEAVVPAGPPPTGVEVSVTWE